MTPQLSLQHNQRISNADDMKAARKYVQRFPIHAMNYLCGCDPHQLLQMACEAEGEDYHAVMSRASGPDDDSKSVSSSRRRTLSSDSGPANESSSSAIVSSSSSVDSTSEILYVIPETGSTDIKTLRATRLAQSNYLIRTDIVRLRLKLKYASADAYAQYKDGPILSCGTISLQWAWNSNDLDSENVQRTTFYVIDDLPGAEAVICDPDAQDSPRDQAGGSPFGLNAELKAYGDGTTSEKRPAPMRHGSSLVQRQYTNTFTANSTAPTIRAMPGTAGQGPRERRPSTALDSRLPRRRSSGSSHGSVAMSQSRTQSGRHTQSTPTPPPQTDSTDEVRVTIVWGQSRFGSIRLQLIAPGGGRFYEQLVQHLRKRRAPHELDRESDMVRFSPHITVSDPLCWLSLVEDEVEDAWADAVQWFKDHKMTSGIYAIVERDGG